MKLKLHTLFNDAGSNLRGKVAGIYLLLLAFNAGAWLWVVLAFRY